MFSLLVNQNEVKLTVFEEFRCKSL